MLMHLRPKKQWGLQQLHVTQKLYSNYTIQPKTESTVQPNTECALSTKTDTVQPDSECPVQPDSDTKMYRVS